MPSPRNPTSRSLLLLTFALATSCAGQVALPPPAADLKAAVEPKPVPGDDIATSQKAYDQYQQNIEGWGDRISAAGGRLCRWSERVYKVKIGCPKG